MPKNAVFVEKSQTKKKHVKKENVKNVWNIFKVNNKDTINDNVGVFIFNLEHNLYFFPSFPIVNFQQVNVCLAGIFLVNFDHMHSIHLYFFYWWQIFDI